jgi:dihydrofolate reductase
MSFSFEAIEAIVAVDQGFGLAKNGQIPWKSKTDMNFFKETTTNNIIVMGSKTLLSLRNALPLPNRLNIVLTREPCVFTNDPKYKDLNNILFLDEQELDSFLKNPSQISLISQEHNKYLKSDYKIFIIGGEQIYSKYCSKCSTIWLTKIKANYECDLIFSYHNVLSNSEQYKYNVYYEDAELQIMRYQQVEPGTEFGLEFETESDSLMK